MKSTIMLLYTGMDLVCMSILAIIAVYSRDDKRYAGKRIYRAMLLLCFALLLSDMGMSLLDGAAFVGGRALLMSMTFIHYASNITISCLWLIYCHARLLEAKPTPLRMFLYRIPWIAGLFLSAASLQTGWLFTFDAGNVYARGPLYFLIAIVGVVYMLGSVILIIRHAKNGAWVHRHDAYQLLVFCLPAAIGGLAQTVHFGISLHPAGITIALLILFTQKQASLITVDSLTGINNRRAFESYLNRKIRESAEGQLLFVMMVDADDFKVINDTHGHEAGDDALTDIADVLRSACLRSDFLARLGGDEFVVVGERKSQQDIEELKSAILQGVAGENETGGNLYRLSLSIGYAVYDKAQHEDTDALVHAADLKMYEVKKAKDSHR